MVWNVIWECMGWAKKIVGVDKPIDELSNSGGLYQLLFFHKRVNWKTTVTVITRFKFPNSVTV